MEYAVLIYGDESVWLNADETTQKKMYAAHGEFASRCAERGHKITAGLELRGTASAKTVRGTAESVTVTDGPYTPRPPSSSVASTRSTQTTSTT